MQTTKFDYLELVNHAGEEYFSCYDRNTHEIVILTEDEYEASSEWWCYLYEEDLVSYKGVVGELERVTGEIFDLNREGVAKRVREVGYTKLGFEEALLKEALGMAWKEPNSLIQILWDAVSKYFPIAYIGMGF